MTSDSAITAGSIVLVTGVNGYIASHVADQFLAHGYAVRGAARDEEKLRLTRETLLAKRPNAKFEGVLVSGFDDKDALRKAVEGVSAVLHTAAPVSAKDDLDIEEWSAQSMRNMLDAAAASPSVKRVVITSSSVATHGAKGDDAFHVDEKTWNDSQYDEFRNLPAAEKKAPSNGFLAYTAGKYVAEKTAWDWYRKEKPSFVLNAVLPNLNTGPKLGAWQSGSTSSWVQNLYNGSSKELLEFFRDFSPQWNVDVRDDALLHVAAATFPDVKERRLFAYGSHGNYNRYVAALKKYGKPKDYLPPGPEGGKEDLSEVENGYSLELLRRLGRKEWRDLEESVKDQIEYTPLEVK